MSDPIITFIGAGNMARSLIGGLVADGYDAHSIWVTNPSVEKLNNLHATFDVQTTQDNIGGAKKADVLVFAVKPHVVPDVVKELSDVIKAEQPLLVSIAAGIRIINIETWLGEKAPIVRCMPNTPALVRTGATTLFATPSVNETQKQQAESLMRAVGVALWVEEEGLMDTVTALSGCGPAYFFLVMEALEEGAAKLGLPTETARLLTLQTALGAARMAMECQEEISVLRDNVTSPGGTTECALGVLEKGQIRALFYDALKAAEQRSIELAEMLNNGSPKRS